MQDNTALGDHIILKPHAADVECFICGRSLSGVTPTCDSLRHTFSFSLLASSPMTYLQRKTSTTIWQS